MKKYLTPILFGLGVLAVITFAIFALRSPEKTDENSSASSTVSGKDLEQLETGYSQGPESASVTLVEFGDYQCPACASAHPILKGSILPEYQGKVRFVFKNFPLTQIHKNATASAQAAEAAGAQDKYWQMHDLLYEKQDEWANLSDPVGKFGEYAASIGLDGQKLMDEVRASKYADRIKDDSSLGEKLKVNGTPTFYVNGKIVDTKEGGINAVKAAIEQALAG